MRVSGELTWFIFCAELSASTMVLLVICCTMVCGSCTSVMITSVISMPWLG